MALTLFGKQPELAWVWIGCGLITFLNYTYPAVDLGELGTVAFIGFIVPIVALVFYSIAKVDAATQ